MIRECFRCNTGIQFYRESFKDVGLDPDTFLDPRPPPLLPTAARVSQVEAAAHAAEATDGTMVDVQASPTAASSFKSEEDEELADALSPKYDQLEISKPWWILELIPLSHREQNRRDYSLNYQWRYVLASSALLAHSFTWVWPSHRWNFGRGRNVPAPVTEKKEKVLVHRSVKIRMEAEGLPEGKYEPKAKFEHFDHEWVD